MKKHLIFAILFVCTYSLKAQVVKGLRIGYIDMEYILKNIPAYEMTNEQLSQLSEKWQNEVEAIQ